MPSRNPKKDVNNSAFLLQDVKKRRPPTLLVRFLGRRKSHAGELVECLPTPVYCMYHQESVP